MEDELVQFIAKSLVDNPDDVSVRRKETSGSVIVHLKVSAADMGRVIGKQGRIANAMRTLLRVVAPEDKRVILEID
ncbi:MAG: KH domain-containing protein [Chloroflexi bacterium]|nr:KH domain-containing protein [Chloroflexota bacterium]